MILIDNGCARFDGLSLPLRHPPAPMCSADADQAPAPKTGCLELEKVGACSDFFIPFPLGRPQLADRPFIDTCEADARGPGAVGAFPGRRHRPRSPKPLRRIHAMTVCPGRLWLVDNPSPPAICLGLASWRSPAAAAALLPEIPRRRPLGRLVGSRNP